jgi:threonine dehydrogenase-like Zn-dependent dehydrogenase
VCAVPETYMSVAANVQMGTAAVIVKPMLADTRTISTSIGAADEIRVRVEGCGVCGSNLPTWEGRPWFTYPLAPGSPGHEAWGWVDEVGSDVTAFRAGDRVAMLSEHAFSEYDVTSESKAVRLPTELDGLHFPAEPLACAVNVIKRCRIQRGESVAVVGIGFLGAVITRLAKLEDARVAGFSRRRFALQTAIAFGADTGFDIADPAKALQDALRWNNNYFDCVIEAAGTQETLDLASQLVRERGRLVIAGYHQDGRRHVDMQLWNWRGIDVINAHERDSQTYVSAIRAAIELVRTGMLDPAPLYTHMFPLNELSNAMEMLRLRPDGFLKALVIT